MACAATTGRRLRWYADNQRHYTGQVPTLTDRLAHLADLLDYLSAEDRRLVEDAYLRTVATAPRHRPTSLHPSVRSHPPEVAATAVASGLARELRTRRALVEDSWSTREVADLLGISPQGVTKRRTKANLLAFLDRGDWRYPRWQFTGSALLPGVLDVWKALPGKHDALGLVRWFTLPARALDDATPLERLRAGALAEVADAASYVGSP